MPRGRRTPPSHTDQTDTAAAPPVAETHAVASFLRSLANRAEADATLAREIHLALVESGLLASASWSRRRTAGPHSGTTASLPDPFQLWRDHGEKGLGDALASLDLPDLRALVRKHRLDPARISARWSDRERVIQLIVSQVKAYAGYGQAFSHV